MITVVVGTHGNAFPVHESLICSSSEFFRTARKPEWSAANPQVVDLGDEEPDIFEAYLHWLYFRTRPTMETHNDPACPEYKRLAHCYVLGEMLIDKNFKNDVVNALIELLEEMKDRIIIPGSDEINIIYAGTIEGSLGRKLMVDIWVAFARKSCRNDLHECHPEFVLDLAKELLEFNNAERLRKFERLRKKYYES
jgi:hypothetical protein